MPEATSTTNLNFVGQRVRLFASGSIYIVRGISLNGKRAFLSLANDPKFIDTADVDTLIIPEPELEPEGDEDGNHIDD